MNSRRSSMNSGRSSLSTQTSWQKRPWVTAFMLDRFLPAGVLGPVDFFALRWLARRFLSETCEVLRGMARLLSRKVWDMRTASGERARARMHGRVARATSKGSLPAKIEKVGGKLGVFVRFGQDAPATSKAVPEL